MRKLHILPLVFSLIALIPLGCAAQRNTPTTVVTSNKTIYDKAIEYGDLNTAIVAAHTILANSPADFHYMDSLVGLYFATGNFVAAINIGNDILGAAPQNVAVREVVANSQLALGLNGEAVLNYQDLYTRTNDLFFLYNVATTQYNMKNFTECGATLDRVLKAEGNMEKIPLTGADGETQEVPIKAAAHNIKGAIALEVNNAAIAKQNFEEALKIAPDFSLAKKNLEGMGK
jgi:tetratricopeptide (TPR) repeat protein